jgi:hypothetical protein
VSEQETGSTEKASEILRRRGDRTSKLQRTIDRGSQRSRAEDPAGDTFAQEEQGRPAKPIRITVDLNAHQHRFLREYCLNTGTKGTAVLRGLLSELAEDQELRSRLTQRLKR